MSQQKISVGFKLKMYMRKFHHNILERLVQGRSGKDDASEDSVDS